MSSRMSPVSTNAFSASNPTDPSPSNANGKRAAVVVEEHSAMGGLGSIVAELLSRHHVCPLERLGLPDLYPPVGTREELIAHYGLDEEHIANAVGAFLREIGR